MENTTTRATTERTVQLTREETILVNILRESKGAAPVVISLNYTKNNIVTSGIVIKEAPGSIVRALTEDPDIITVSVTPEGLVIVPAPSPAMV